MATFGFENRVAIVTGAGAGWYARAAVLTGGGFLFNNDGHDVTVEEIRDHIEQINDLNQAKIYQSAFEILADIFHLKKP